MYIAFPGFHQDLTTSEVGGVVSLCYRKERRRSEEKGSVTAVETLHYPWS